jgi:hypothetical protein
MTAYRVADACPRCGSEATTTNGECRACGHVWGASHVCVHCLVVCPVLPNPALGNPCSACGVPRIATGWAMPEAAANRLRRAVAKRRMTARVASVAFGLAIVCIPLGLLTRGLSEWLTLLVLWLVSISFAAVVRGSGRRTLSSELVRVQRAWQEEADLEKSPHRIRIAETPEPGDEFVPASAQADETTGERRRSS